jgi:hypothetical protein
MTEENPLESCSLKNPARYQQAIQEHVTEQWSATAKQRADVVVYLSFVFAPQDARWNSVGEGLTRHRSVSATSL